MRRICWGMLMHCGFCEANGELSKFGTVIHDDDHSAVVLHPDSAVAGHAMLIWKRHVENVADLRPDELASFSRIHRAAERALLDETRRERAVLLKLGIQTPHLHLHIYPVSSSAGRDDVMAAINGAVEEPRPGGFAERCRRRLTDLLA
ncbi:MAG TPA: HIT family protein [Thermoanaerobaculia bacterium]|nr:HIT family protein [Thermoanaerobaculia bacterium]